MLVYIENQRTIRSASANLDRYIFQDTQWSDSDYKIQTRDFTNDVEVFGNISEFANDLHDRGMKYIIIVVSVRTFIRTLANGTAPNSTSTFREMSALCRFV